MAVINRFWKIVMAAGVIVGVIASAIQIAQAVRDGDLSLVLVAVVVICDIALLLALGLIIHNHRASKSARMPQRGRIAIAVIAATLLATTASMAVSLVKGGENEFVSPSPGSSTSTSPTDRPTAKPTSTQADCVDETGAGVSCDDTLSYFPTMLTACAPDDVLRQFGIDPTEQQLDVETMQAGNSCLLRPGPTARSAGATGRDFARLQEGIVDTRFRLCLPTDQGPLVPCTKLHHVELVSQAIEVGLAPNPDASVCIQPARKYTLRSLNDSIGDLQPVLLGLKSGDRPTYRCGVRSSRTLKDTVWHLGTTPLPTS